MAITIDAASNSGDNSSTNTISFNHTCAASADMILVGVMGRDSTGTADLVVSSVTYNGTSLTSLVALQQTHHAGYGGAAILALPNPDTGSAYSIAITMAGSCNVLTGWGLSVIGAKNTTTPNATGTGHDDTFDSSDPSVGLTTNVDDCLIVDACYDLTSYDNMTIGASQTQITKIAANGGGDESVGSYEQGGTAGAKTMSWSTPGPGAGQDAWISVAAAIEPAAAAAGIRSERQLVGHGQGTRD